METNDVECEIVTDTPELTSLTTNTTTPSNDLSDDTQHHKNPLSNDTHPPIEDIAMVTNDATVEEKEVIPSNHENLDSGSLSNSGIQISGNHVLEEEMIQTGSKQEHVEGAKGGEFQPVLTNLLKRRGSSGQADTDNENEGTG